MNFEKLEAELDARIEELEADNTTLRDDVTYWRSRACYFEGLLEQEQQKRKRQSRRYTGGHRMSE